MAFIVGAKRTAFGAFGGSLKALSPTVLCTKARPDYVFSPSLSFSRLSLKAFFFILFFIPLRILKTALEIGNWETQCTVILCTAWHYHASS